MFDDLQGFVWIDGQFVPWKDARVHIMTHALHYASSVFEGIRSYNGKIFKGPDHYQRLHDSANYLDFQVPYSVEELVEATKQLIAKGSYQDGYIRALAWCGSKKMTVSHNGADVHTAIGVWERKLSYPAHYYTDGISMNISDWRRPDPRTAPVHSKAAGLYMTSSMSKAISEKLGFNDALMLDYQNNIAEATSSNIFLVIDGKLYTPIADCFLNGLTRLTCIKIAKYLGIQVEEIKLSLDDLSRAQEVFNTGTAIEILPVGSIEGNGQIWKFKPGKITNAIRAEYKNVIENL